MYSNYSLLTIIGDLTYLQFQIWTINDLSWLWASAMLLALMYLCNWHYKRIKGLIQLIGRATMGTYHLRYSEQEHLMSIVLYWLGGTWVTEFAHAALSMPGLSITQSHCMTSIQASLSFLTQNELTSNITTAYQIDTPCGDWVIGLVCMIDEIQVEEVLDWCPCMNGVIGLCWEHSRCEGCVLDNIDDAHLLFDDLQIKGSILVQRYVYDRSLWVQPQSQSRSYRLWLLK